MIRIAITTAIGLTLSLSALTGAYASHRIGGESNFESHGHSDYRRGYNHYGYYNFHNYCDYASYGGYHNYCPYFSYGSY